MKKYIQKIAEFAKNTTVRVVSLILVLCFILSIIIFPKFYKTQINKLRSFYYVYQGDKAYKKRQPQKALDNYTIALKLHPKHTRARYNLANLYVAYEDYYTALENYQMALELKPNFMIARIDYAIVLSEAMFNFDKAIEEYDIAIKRAPKWMYIPFIIDNKKTYKYNKGVAYYNQGLAWRGKSLLFGQDRFKAREYLINAINSYEKALKSIKEYDVYYNLGIANQLLGRKAMAGRNYCLAIELEPMNYEAHFNLAILLKSMNKYIDSAEEFKKAGLLLDGKGDVNKTRYVYDVLNEVNQRMAQDIEYKEILQKMSEEDPNEGKVTYIGGKLVISEDFDKAMYKNFKTCANRDLFYGGEDSEIELGY
ncbi:MAG: tetratricopeptide repeat protein [Candidatus Gastranaerophilales bacterium]|nr:tetratricopeptide repeat protein [Candidatus Gastranaerophilales bacterium]